MRSFISFSQYTCRLTLPGLLLGTYRRTQWSQQPRRHRYSPELQTALESSLGSFIGVDAPSYSFGFGHFSIPRGFLQVWRIFLKLSIYFQIDFDWRCYCSHGVKRNDNAFR